MIEDSKSERSQRHTVGPVPPIRTSGMEEIGVPLWDGRGEESDGYQAAKQGEDVKGNENPHATPVGLRLQSQIGRV